MPSLARFRFLLVPALAAGLVASGAGIDRAFARAAHSPPNAHHVYRLDYAVTLTEPNAAPVVSQYTMNVEEGAHGELRVGANVPLQTGPSMKGAASPRQDVGVVLKSQPSRAGDDLIVHLVAEISAPDASTTDGPRAIRKLVSSDDAVVTLGKPSLVAVLDEPSTHAHYEIDVTATQLR